MARRVALLLCGLGMSDAACSASVAGKPVDGAASSAPSASDQDLAAKIAAGAPPKDMTWKFRDPPADWKRLQTEAGVEQWQIGSSRCAVTLSQPSGLGTSSNPDSDEVAEHYAQRSAKAAGARPKVDAATDTMQKALINDGQAQASLKTSQVHFGDKTKKIEGISRGYRAGDFAVSAVAACGGGEFTAQKSAVTTFFDENLVIGVRY